MYLVLREGNKVYEINVAQRRLKLVAGTGETGYTGDGGPAVDAKLNGPKGITYASDGSLYISDTESHVIRRIDPSHHFLGERLNFWVSIVVFLCSTGFFVWWQFLREPGDEPARPTRARPIPKGPAMAIPKGRVRSGR